MRYLLTLLVLCAFYSPNGHVKEYIKTLTRSENAAKLQNKQGYLLVYLDVNGVAPSIQIAKIRTKKTNYVSDDEKKSFVNTYLMRLKGKEKGFYLVPMLEGIYQVTRINAPYYDLPYWLPTDNNKTWRFSIQANSINFIGELSIAKERGTAFINVRLKNRLALYKNEIAQALTQQMAVYPLASSAGYRDDFLIELGSSPLE